jgi:hypothetical protein
MKYHEMPMRLRDFLPAFQIETGRKESDFAKQVEGLAEFLHKQPRTIRSYLSTSRHERMISAEDYWKVTVEWVKRRSKSSRKDAFFVLDSNGDQIYEAVWQWQATFLVDVCEEAAEIHVRKQDEWQLRQLDDPAKRRSRLRRLVRNRILKTETICEVMEFDLYCLVDYQMEGVDWRSSPEETKLQTLERMEAKMMGAAS